MRINLLMRFKGIFIRLFACVVLTVAPLHAAQAESFFQKLFGWGSASAEKPAPPSAKPVPSLKSFSRTSPAGSGAAQYSNPDEEQVVLDDPNGSYRTLCVRTCDGFYFPISSRVASNRFSRDARRCESQCGSDAKLFYMPRSSDDVKNMTDLSGSVYGRMPTAFAYRKSLINGCTCKPMPWSIAETARHNHYALIDKLNKSQERNAEIARTMAAAVPGSEDAPSSATVATKLAEAIGPVQAAATPEVPDQTMLMAFNDVKTRTDNPADDTGDAAAAFSGHLLPAAMQDTTVADPPVTSETRRQKRPRRPAAARLEKSASWFPAQAKYSWPGDAPARRK
jgi:hypothetical protein